MRTTKEVITGGGEGRIHMQTPFASRAIALLLSAFVILTGCAARSLQDPEQTCRIAVDDKANPPTFVRNPFSNAGGGLVGAGAGALAGLQGGMAAPLTIPIGAVIGAISGSVCAVGSSARPTADADFERIFRETDSSAFRRALEAELNAPRAACSSVTPDGSAGAMPDAVIEIEQVVIGMKCLVSDEQRFLVVVPWRAVDTKTRKVVVASITTCEHKSSRSIDGWFAAPDNAKAEIERALADAGRSVAMQLLGKNTSCRQTPNSPGPTPDRHPPETTPKQDAVTDRPSS